jgi:uncharacterized membrane protein YagU involved in acid resistance
MRFFQFVHYCSFSFKFSFRYFLLPNFFQHLSILSTYAILFAIFVHSRDEDPI